jgi:hypothetical protein
MKAVFSPCGKYRYTLHRKISQPIRWVRKCLFVLLNPSTATDTEDDPTIRRCIAFAKRQGVTDLTIVNLFALRSTNPKGLFEVKDPEGPDNFSHLTDQLKNHRNDLIFFAWGSTKTPRDMSKVIETIAIELDVFFTVKCLGFTKNGSPRHPLYAKHDAPFVPYIETTRDKN